MSCTIGDQIDDIAPGFLHLAIDGELQQGRRVWLLIHADHVRRAAML